MLSRNIAENVSANPITDLHKSIFINFASRMNTFFSQITYIILEMSVHYLKKFQV